MAIKTKQYVHQIDSFKRVLTLIEVNKLNDVPYFNPLFNEDRNWLGFICRVYLFTCRHAADVAKLKSRPSHDEVS